MIKRLGLLAAASVGVALATAVYWNATTFCADCTGPSYDLDNVVRLLGEEGAAAGVIFLLGGLFWPFLEHKAKDLDHG